MTKRQLFEILEKYDDDTEICLVEYDGPGGYNRPLEDFWEDKEDSKLVLVLN